MWKRRGKDCLYFQLFRLIIMSALLTSVLFVSANYLGNSLIDRWYYSSGYEQKKDEDYIRKLQSYIRKNEIGSEDLGELGTWVKKLKVISISIYKDGRLLFDSDYPDTALWEDNISSQEYEWESYYDLSLKDGPARVTIWGAYSSQYYTYYYIAEIICCSILFIFFILFGIRGKIEYIAILCEDIKILEAGNLDYSVTIRGRDELSALAESLDGMRQSFSKLVQREGNIMREHQKVVTEMSHDLRTPVTSMLLYLEILRKGAWDDRDRCREYIGKLERKAQQMKRLTEHLFKYNLVAGEKDVNLGETQYYEQIFYDMLSDICYYLKDHGFQVETEVTWYRQKVSVCMDYMGRIMDNITSNIIKYADRTRPVIIQSLYEKDKAGISFSNWVRFQKSDSESTNVGLQSIRYMIEKMGGSCNSVQDDSCYKIQFLLPVIMEKSYDQ